MLTRTISDNDLARTFRRFLHSLSLSTRQAHDGDVTVGPCGQDSFSVTTPSVKDGQFSMSSSYDNNYDFEGLFHFSSYQADSGMSQTLTPPVGDLSVFHCLTSSLSNRLQRTMLPEVLWMTVQI